MTGALLVYIPRPEKDGMGQHTRKPHRDAQPHGGVRAPKAGWIGKLPLLSMVSLIVMVAMVATAISTQKVALNFGGAPPPRPGTTANATDPARPAHAAQDDFPRPRRTGAGRGSNRPAVTVMIRTTSRWIGGFQGEVTITNQSGLPLRGWSLSFRYPTAQILAVWGVTIVSEGAALTVRNAAFQAPLAPGRSLRVPFTAQGSPGTVAACTFNGKSCY